MHLEKELDNRFDNDYIVINYDNEIIVKRGVL